MFDFIDALTIKQQIEVARNSWVAIDNTIKRTLNIQNSISELIGDSYYVVNLLRAISMDD
jgi:hypothetical protein